MLGISRQDGRDVVKLRRSGGKIKIGLAAQIRVRTGGAGTLPVYGNPRPVHWYCHSIQKLYCIFLVKRTLQLLMIGSES